MSENNIVNIGQKPTNLKGGLMKSRAKRIVGSVVAGLLLGGVAGSASASAVATLSIRAVDITSSPWDGKQSSLSTTLNNVYVGEVVYYQLHVVADTAWGQAFSNVSVPVSGTWGANGKTDGINSLGTISLLQAKSTGVSMSFSPSDPSAVPLAGSLSDASPLGQWGQGTNDGTNGGMLQDPRSDGGYDLGGIRLVRPNNNNVESLTSPTVKYTHWQYVLPTDGGQPRSVIPDDVALTGTFTVISVANNGSTLVTGDMMIAKYTGTAPATTTGFDMRNVAYAPNLDTSDGTLNTVTGNRTLPAGNDPAFLWTPLTLNGPVVTQGVPTPSALLGGALLGALVAYRRWKRA